MITYTYLDRLSLDERAHSDSVCFSALVIHHKPSVRENFFSLSVIALG